MPKILIIAAPRTGSTLVCDLLKRKGIEPLYEIFHSDKHILSQYLNRYKDALTEIINADQELDENFVNKKYSLLFKKVEELTNNSFSIKIFPHQVNEEILNYCIKYFDIVIFLNRNPFNTFISNTIAKEVRKWGGVNTGHIKIKFIPADFLKEFKDIYEHHLSANKLVIANAKKYIKVSYEFLEKKNILPKEFSEFINIDGDLNSEIPTKQDHRENILDKVINPTELFNFAQSNSLENYLSSNTSFDILNYSKIIENNTNYLN